MSLHDPEERPEGLETRENPIPLPSEGERPEWLVGADDVLESTRDPIEQRPMAPLPTTPPGGPTGVVAGGARERAKGWSGAGSSIPKLTVMPSLLRPETGEERDPQAGGATAPEEEPLEADDATDAGGEAPRALAVAPPPIRRLDEPWYLVWGEALATNRKVQLGVLAVAVVAALIAFVPRRRETGASLGAILRHPERFEGRPVVVHGQALESFALGQGFVFHLRQGRDTVVVFSPTRQPRLHERVEVVGTVSTGYLDGEPRVALFESPGGAP